jgi:ribosome-associated protein
MFNGVFYCPEFGLLAESVLSRFGKCIFPIEQRKWKRNYLMKSLPVYPRTERSFAMIMITKAIEIDEETLQFKLIYVSGPGGQHVYKNRTAMRLQFDIVQAHSLGRAVQQRLIELAGNRVSSDFKLIITARRYRSQERNRQDAKERLFELIRCAAEPPKPRIKQRPSRAAHQDRLNEKRKRSEIKAGRRSVMINY